MKSGEGEPICSPSESELTRGEAMRQLALVWLGAFAIVLPGLISAVRIALSMPFRVPSWVDGDIDTGLIMEGLRNAPNPEDTLRWWTGPWVGIVPFYRPLTSYLFWIEWKAFGEYEPAYLYPTVALHLIAIMLFAGFARALARRYRHPWAIAAGALAGAAFSGLPGTPRRGIASAAYLAWKNQPDIAAAIFVFGALSLYLLCLRGRRGALPGAMFLYLIACGFKEIAVPLPAICLFLEPDLRIWRGDGWKRVVAMGATGVFFLVVRYLALRGLGYTYGSNEAAATRTLSTILGPFGSLVLGNWLITVVVVGSAAAFLLAWKWHRARATTHRAGVGSKWGSRLGWAALIVGWLAVLGTLGFVDVVRESGRPLPELLTLDGWASGLLHLIITARINDAHLMVIALGLLALLYRQAPHLLRLGFAWVVILMLPLTLSPGPVHRLYLPEGGYSLLTGLGLAWLPAMWPAVRAHRAKPRNSDKLSDEAGARLHPSHEPGNRWE